MDKEKKIAVVLGCNIHWAPYYYRYETLLQKEKLTAIKLAAPVLARKRRLCERGWRISVGFNFCSWRFGRTVCAYVQLLADKLQLPRKYAAGGAACSCEEVFTLREGLCK